MIGNVFEWWAPDPNTPPHPSNDAAKWEHFLRGGSYMSKAPYCRTGFRHRGYTPYFGFPDYGFRAACSVEP